MGTVRVSANVEEYIRDGAERVLAAYGMDIPAAVKMFLTATAKKQAFPIDFSNGSTGETERTMQNTEKKGQAEQIKKRPTSKIYTSKDEFRRDIKEMFGLSRAK